MIDKVNIPEPDYRPRLADQQISTLLKQFPAVLINGPRAAGKTTTALRHAAQVVRLDQPTQAAAFEADPDAALRNRPEPLLLDEWQEVPEVLGAVKRSIDNDSRAGRFVLTGSVRSDLEHRMWPGTGRLIRTRMYGMTEREIAGVVNPARSSLINKLELDDAEAITLPDVKPDLRDYIEIALRGGFPGLALKDDVPKDVWVDSYLDQLLSRDAHSLVANRVPQKLARYFEAVASSSAGIPEHKTLYDAAGINRLTADTYDELLSRLYITESIPAWSSNYINRLTKTPKRYVVDGALMASALGATTETVMADSDLLGRMIDTFAMSQIRPEIASDPRRIRQYHLRTKAGREEVDILLELPGRKLLAVEVKASASPSSSDGKHLRWLRDKFPDDFVTGVVLHTGTDVYRLDSKILAVPMCAFWG